jgi:hypothetical protein
VRKKTNNKKAKVGPKQPPEMPARKTVFELERRNILKEERILVEILAHGESAFDRIPLSVIEKNLTFWRQILYRRALRARNPDQREALRILKSLAEENATALLWLYRKQPELVRAYASLQKTWPFNVSVKNLARNRKLLDEMKVGTDCLRPTSKGKTFKSLWSEYAESIVKSFMYAQAVYTARRGEKPTITDGYAPISEFREISDERVKRIALLPLPLSAKGAKEAWWKEAKIAIEEFWNHNLSEYQRAMDQVDEKTVDVIRHGSTSKDSYVWNQIRDAFYDVLDRYVARQHLKAIDSE